MDLLKYVNGVLFIDDRQDDIKILNDYFMHMNVPTMFLNPNEYDGEVNSSIGFTRIVFLDLSYAGGEPDLLRVVSLLRSLAEKELKNIILILWTLHDNHVDDLIDLINKKMKAEKPVLILDAKKSDFQGISFEECSEKLDLLFKDSIESNELLYKLLQWERMVNISAYKTFNEIVAFSFDDISDMFLLENSFTNMASRTVYENKISSAFDVANDMLVDNVKSESNLIENTDLIGNVSDSEKYKLNFLMMFENTLLFQQFPGNIYLRMKNDSDSEVLSLLDDCEKYKPISVDFTPECSFRTENRILINGCIIENITEAERKNLRGYYKKDSDCWDVYINSKCQLCWFCIQFFNIQYVAKSDLTDTPIACLKYNYKISIQQKFGNYLGRIGNTVYHKK